MKLIRRVLVSGLAVLALVVRPAVSAEAASISFDVTKLSAKNVVVTNSNCRNVEVDMNHKKSGVSYWDVDAEITRSGSYIGYAYFSYSKYVDRTDYTKGSFYIRGKAYASLSTKRSGKTVTLTSKTKVYNPAKYGKVNYNPKVKFQVKSDSKWKALKTVSAKKGKATYKVKTKSKKSYRVTFSQASWATGATSKSSKR